MPKKPNPVKVDKKEKEWRDFIDTAYKNLSHNPRHKELFYSLLGFGYFPNQLPPPFQTYSFMDAVKANPKPFLNKLKQCYFKKTARVCPFYYARPKMLRRVLGITNPAHHALLSLEIASYWPELETVSNDSSYALSKPRIYSELDEDEQGSPQRALTYNEDWEDWPAKKLSSRANARYLLIADISRCFPSIYTHSIPWALHGKPKAKAAKHDYSLLGNRLDAFVRNGQDGQTLGIPIGPDTSFLISECILAKIDKEIEQRIPKEVKATRLVDDYEFACPDRVTADKCLAIIQQVMQGFELELNTLKSQIVELPQPIQSPEIAALRRFDFGKPSSVNLKKLLEFIDLSFECYRQHPKGALKYAVKRIPEDINPELTVPLNDFMCQCMILEPGVIEVVLKRISTLEIFDDDANDVFCTCFEKIIAEHAPLGHTSEVAWAIWGHLVLNKSIPDSAIDHVASMQDSIVLLLALDAKSKDLTNNKKIIAAAKTLLKAEQLNDEQWLLAYEAVKKGWAPVGFRSHVTKDKFFNYLKLKNVHFYIQGADIASYRTIMKEWRGSNAYDSSEPEDDFDIVEFTRQIEKDKF